MALFPRGPLFRPAPPTTPADIQAIAERPLSRPVGPIAVQVTAAKPILLVDLTDAEAGGALVCIANLGPDTIFWGFSPSAVQAPTLTTTNGFPLLSSASVFLDRVGGLAIWARTTVLQVAPADTRITGGKI